MQRDCKPAAVWGTVDMMNNDHRTVILAAVARTPDWLRRELAASDDQVRQRAEDALAAIIASALEPKAAA